MLYLIHFSPTGGTKAAADIIGEAWEAKKCEIDLTRPEDTYKKYEFTRDDVCIVAVPSYGGRVPVTALERINKMSGNDAAAIAVTTYGNRDYDDTLLELKELLTNRGFRAGAAVVAVTEHSIMRQYGTGRPDEADRQQLREFGRQIEKAFANGKLRRDIKVKGKHPFRQYNGVPMKPKADGKCTSCGRCAKLCPTKAIPVDNPKSTDEQKCISCMRCIQVCPENARKLNTLMFKAASAKLKKHCSSRKENECIM